MRAQEDADAVLGARNDQRHGARIEADRAAAADTVAEHDAVELGFGAPGINAFLEKFAEPRRVGVQARRQELHPVLVVRQALHDKLDMGFEDPAGN